jgi:ABC-2 type transport system permease protein
VRGAVDQIKEITAEDPYLPRHSLRRTAAARRTVVVPVPLIAIGLGFDAVNGEHNWRTLSRPVTADLSRRAFPEVRRRAVHPVDQPYRAFVAGDRFWIGWSRRPNAEEMARALVLLVVTIAYGGFWFALALLFSMSFARPPSRARLAGGMAVPASSSGRCSRRRLRTR